MKLLGQTSQQFSRPTISLTRSCRAVRMWWREGGHSILPTCRREPAPIDREGQRPREKRLLTIRASRSHAKPGITFGPWAIPLLWPGRSSGWWFEVRVPKRPHLSAEKARVTPRNGGQLGQRGKRGRRTARGAVRSCVGCSCSCRGSRRSWVIGSLSAPGSSLVCVAEGGQVSVQDTCKTPAGGDGRWIRPSPPERRQLMASTCITVMALSSNMTGPKSGWSA